MGKEEERRGTDPEAGTEGRAAPAVDREPSCAANVDRLLRAVAGDQGLLARLVTTFLEDYPEKLESIREALEKSDARALERAAHSYRGALTILGAEEACCLAAGLEELAKAGTLEKAAPLARELEVETERLADFLAEKAGLPPRR
ncbi:MAG: Hpt domain-containing protein [Deltaproteobacteria bacterium]|nr:Hpt domain-containing protein [Deltaproteobacteria bacterium]